MRVSVIEPCPGKWSSVVHTYSPRYQHDSQLASDDDDSATASQRDLDDHDNDDESAGGGSGAVQPGEVRGRYGRRYDPPETVIVVERPSPSERTQPPHDVTTSAATRHGHVAVAATRITWLLLVTFVRTCTAFSYCCTAIAVHFCYAAVLQQ